MWRTHPTAKNIRRAHRVGWITCALCAIAVLLLFVEVETVIISGAVITLFGLTMFVMGLRYRYRQWCWIGIAHVGICVLFVALVNTFNWSPDEAFAPFLILGTLHVTGTAMWTRWAQSRAPDVSPTWACTACGYSLWGLPEPRCPECGKAFDPRAMAELPPPPEAVGLQALNSSSPA